MQVASALRTSSSRTSFSPLKDELQDNSHKKPSVELVRTQELAARALYRTKVANEALRVSTSVLKTVKICEEEYAHSERSGVSAKPTYAARSPLGWLYRVVTSCLTAMGLFQSQSDKVRVETIAVSLASLQARHPSELQAMQGSTAASTSSGVVVGMQTLQEAAHLSKSASTTVPNAVAFSQTPFKSPFLSLFGARRKAQTGVPSAQLQIDLAVEAIQLRISLTEQRVQELRADAQKHLISGRKTDRADAMRCLKMAKSYEVKMGKLADMSVALETQRSQLEDVSLQQEIVAALGASVKDMKRAKHSIQNVEEVVDDTCDMRDVADERMAVFNGLSETTFDANGFDEDELEQELQEMQTAFKEASTGVVSDVSSVRLSLGEMPVTPTNVPFPTASSESRRLMRGSALAY